MFKRKIKNKNFFMKNVEVKASTIDKDGLGVFATEFIGKHEMFESSPVLIWHRDLLAEYSELHLAAHLLTSHVFIWKGHEHALCLGYGTIYNHSNEPNAMHRRKFDKTNPRIEFIALKDIQPGEEIFHHYSPRAGDLFFTDAGTAGHDRPLNDKEKRQV